MSEEQLQALEADLGVGLPPQYRCFLLHSMSEEGEPALTTA
ncbi:SMI1/KNR4 family protein [Streptomyces sp. NPDC056004]